ncbi:MAG: imidazolonepropionase [Firmicutes bacterium]|nr:imidazolonepropionase [Bacillota bacterium]
MTNISLKIENIAELITVAGPDEKRCGKAQGEIERIRDAIVLVEGEKIVYAGSVKEAPKYELNADATVIDATGKTVTPGLIDSHTHLVHGGSRENELNKKLHGASYLDILRAGGGIMYTLKKTKEMSEDELYNQALKSVDRLMSYGVTTVEAKTGYGIDSIETEFKQLNVADRIDKNHPIDVIHTFMGAHAVPEEYKENPAKFIDIIIEEYLPRFAEDGRVKFCDVFCEDSVFNAEDSKRLLLAAKEHGLIPKIHADEIAEIGGTKVAGEVGAISAEHLIKCTEEGIAHLKSGDVIANLLPGTSFNMGDHIFAPARAMIENGVAVAISTDYNPGSCPTENIQLCMYLACLNMKMTPEEVLVGVTINAAAALGLEKEKGSLMPGKRADIAIFDAPNLDYILYHFGINHTDKVIKDGKLVYEAV